jgi:hypothetical protein
MDGLLDSLYFSLGGVVAAFIVYGIWICLRHTAIRNEQAGASRPD